MAAYGLQTQIWNNNAKSVLLLAGFPVLLTGLIYALSLLYFAFSGQGGDSINLDRALVQAAYNLPNVLPFALGGAAIWFGIAWLGHQAMIDMATGARPVTRDEHPREYNLLENLCISRGMTMPQLRIIDSPALNAFASGLSEGKMSVTLTSGIVKVLDDDELEAVIGHELTHIRNRDVRLLVISVIFVGIFSFVGQMLFRNMFYMNLGRSDRYRRSGGGNAGAMILIAFAIIAITWFLAVLVRFAISRKREYLADAGSVELTHNPDAMIRALMKISGHADLRAPAEVQQMFIENPAASGSFAGLFATHPPMQARIDALVMMGGKVPDRLEMPSPEPELEAAETADNDPQTRRGPWGPHPRKRGPWG